MTSKFSVSGQHYLFSVQSFAQTVLALGEDEYAYEFKDRSTQDAINDVANGLSELAILFQASDVEKDLSLIFDAADLSFTNLADSAPRVALPKAHPLSSRESLTLEDLEPYPYTYFYQGSCVPDVFAEEAYAKYPRKKTIACTDRASLSELCVALNGYTITSGILVGVTDGSLLTTVPLESDLTLHLGYVSQYDEELSEPAQIFISNLKKSLERYAFN